MKKISLRWFLIAGVVYLALMVSLFLVLILPQILKIKELEVKLNSDTFKSSAIQQKKEIAASRNGLKETGAILKNRPLIPEKSILTRLLGLSQKANIRISSVTPIIAAPIITVPILQTDIAADIAETDIAKNIAKTDIAKTDIVKNIAQAASKVSFKIVFTGNYRQIVDFIHLLESDQALFQIDRLTLENAENLHRGEIDVGTYTK